MFDISCAQIHKFFWEWPRNLLIAAPTWLESSRNVLIGPRMSPGVIIQNTAESHIQEYIKNVHSDVIPAHHHYFFSFFPPNFVHFIDHISIINGQFWFILGKTKVYRNIINFNGLARA